MPAKKISEPASLRWLHALRRKHYQRTKDLPLEAWLQDVDPKKTAAACERLGLRIRTVPVRTRQALRTRA